MVADSGSEAQRLLLFGQGISSMAMGGRLKSGIPQLLGKMFLKQSNTVLPLYYLIVFSLSLFPHETPLQNRSVAPVIPTPNDTVVLIIK